MNFHTGHTLSEFNVLCSVKMTLETKLLDATQIKVTTGLILCALDVLDIAMLL